MSGCFGFLLGFFLYLYLLFFLSYQYAGGFFELTPCEHFWRFRRWIVKNFFEKILDKIFEDDEKKEVIKSGLQRDGIQLIIGVIAIIIALIIAVYKGVL